MAVTYIWDVATQRYRDRAGRFLAATSPQVTLGTALTRVTRHQAELNAQVRAGEITLDAWRVEMQTIIKQVRMAGAALAHGGFDKLAAEDIARVEEGIAQDFGNLEVWTQELAAGDAPSDGRMNSRGQLYVNQGRVVYHDERHEAMDAAGFDEVRSILHPAEHCQLCVLQAEIGWQDLADFIPIGQRTCLSNDQCSVEYRRSLSVRVVA